MKMVALLEITSEISKRTLKVANFHRSNNTLSLPITSVIGSLTLSRDILRFWIGIIINNDLLIANLHHVFQTYIRHTTR